MKNLLVASILILSINSINAQNLSNVVQDEPIDSLKGITPTINDSRIDKLNKAYKTNFKLEGYRVQIFSGNKRQAARQARQQFTQLYGTVKAHEIYEQPYFKVKVGDFKTKIEALKFKNELTKHFPNCFILKENIEFK